MAMAFGPTSMTTNVYLHMACVPRHLGFLVSHPFQPSRNVVNDHTIVGTNTARPNNDAEPRTTNVCVCP